MYSSDSDGDCYFADEIAGGLDAEGFGDLVEREDFADYGLDAIDFDGADQLVERGARAHADAVQAAALEHEVVRVGVTLFAREHADERDFALPSEALERAVERIDAAVFDHAI